MQESLRDKTLNRLIEKVDHKYYGKYRGIVDDNKDPEHLGRLKLRVPSVLGSEVVTGWAMPCLPYGGKANQGFFFIPEDKASVWVEFEAGDLEYPIWVGTFWSKPGGASEVPKPNKPDDGTEESDVQDPATCKIIKTRKGHTLQFEDADDKEMIFIKEAKSGHWVTINEKGIHIHVKHGKTSQEITVDNEGIKVEAGAKAIHIACKKMTIDGELVVNKNTTVKQDLTVGKGPSTTISGNRITGAQ